MRRKAHNFLRKRRTSLGCFGSRGITRGVFPRLPFGVMNHAGRFPAELLSFFISFLSRERKETKQRKETAARAKFACTPGAPPLGLKCLRRKRRETFDEL